MQQATLPKSEQYHLGGIKLSEDLTYFTCRYHLSHHDLFSRTLDTLSAREINLHYLSHACETDNCLAGFCTSTRELDKTWKLMSPLLSAGCTVEKFENTGTLTLFPHRNSLRMLSDVLQLFQLNKLQVHTFCTSISALTMVLNSIDLDRSIVLLKEIVELPKNHAPLRQEFTVRQVCF